MATNMDIVKSPFFQVIKRIELSLFLICFIAGLSLFGWLSGKIGLASISLKFHPMEQSTAVIFIALCILFSIYINLEKSRFIKSFVTLLLIIIAIFCSIIFLDYHFNFAWDVENIFIRNSEKFGSVLIGRMSPITSILFIFICMGIWGIRQNNSNINKYIGGRLSLFLCFISIILLLSYLYNSPLLYGGQIIHVSLSASICFFLFSITLVRESGLKFQTFNLIKGNRITIQLLKSLIPIVVFIIIIDGYLVNIISFHDANLSLTSALLLLIAGSISLILIIRVSMNVVVQSLKSEQELQKNKRILHARIKELKGTFSLEQIAEKSENLEDIYNEFVNIIVPYSMLYSKKVIVSLEIGGKIYCNNENIRLLKTKKYLSASINVFGKNTGKLIVAYTQDKLFIDNFERQLINNFARRISKITERIEIKQMLKETESSLQDAQRIVKMGSWKWEMVS